jgi:hypothetical protein
MGTALNRSKPALLDHRLKRLDNRLEAGEVLLNLFDRQLRAAVPLPVTLVSDPIAPLRHAVKEFLRLAGPNVALAIDELWPTLHANQAEQLTHSARRRTRVLPDVLVNDLLAQTPPTTLVTTLYVQPLADRHGQLAHPLSCSPIGGQQSANACHDLVAEVGLSRCAPGHQRLTKQRPVIREVSAGQPRPRQECYTYVRNLQAVQSVTVCVSNSQSMADALSQLASHPPGARVGQTLSEQDQPVCISHVGFERLVWAWLGMSRHVIAHLTSKPASSLLAMTHEMTIPYSKSSGSFHQID